MSRTYVCKDCGAEKIPGRECSDVRIRTHCDECEALRLHYRYGSALDVLHALDRADDDEGRKTRGGHW
jgi:hypothetical protein